MGNLDYYEIGQRVRKFRKAHNYSQDFLAEMIEISTTHLSHIETGNTKLSLQVLVDLAEALQVSADELLYDSNYGTEESKSEIIHLLDSCSAPEINVIKDTIIAVKTSIDKYIS